MTVGNIKNQFLTVIGIIKAITFIFLIISLYGCSGIEVAPPSPESAYPQPTDITKRPWEPESVQIPGTGPAGSLYQSAKVHTAQGNYEQAELSMERALRVEPTNGYYWYNMAHIKYKRKQYSQAIQLCLKSKSFAGSNTKLMQLNDALIQKAENTTP